MPLYTQQYWVAVWNKWSRKLDLYISTSEAVSCAQWVNTFVIDRELIAARSVIVGRRVRNCRCLVPGAPVNHEHQGTRIEARARNLGNMSDDL